MDIEKITVDSISLDEIERAVIKKFRSKLWAPFIKGIKEYEMIEEGDKIAVCISGGKDSLLCAKLFQELQKHGDKNFKLEFISMDPGFHDVNRQNMIFNCKQMGIPIKIYDSQIFEIVDKVSNKYPCYLCARMRRGALYNFAEELGCNKIALGHHYDDVIETTMMNVLYSGTFKTMLPRLKSKNYEGMELIRPMIYIREDDIKAYMKHINVFPMDCGCVVAAGKTSSKRKEIKEFIKNYKKIYSDVDKSIFSAGQNVNVESIMGYTKDGKKINYIEDYFK